MDVKRFRRMLFGGKMPDKNDPKYKECYERDADAERYFARAIRINKAVAKVRGFVNAHRALFLVIVFGSATCGLARNIYRLAVMYRHRLVRRTATEMQDSVLWGRHKMFSVPHVRRFNTEESGTERPG